MFSSGLRMTVMKYYDGFQGLTDELFIAILVG